MGNLRVLTIGAVALLLAACHGGGGGHGSSSAAAEPVAAVALSLINTATRDDNEPFPVDVLAIVTTPEDEKAADI